MHAERSFERTGLDRAFWHGRARLGIPGFQGVPLSFQLSLHLCNARLDGIVEDLGTPVRLRLELHAEALCDRALVALHLSCRCSRLRFSLRVPAKQDLAEGKFEGRRASQP